MKKRITSVIMALCMTLSLLPVNVWAATPRDTPAIANDETGLRQLLENKTANIQLKPGINIELTTTTGPLEIAPNYEVTLDLNGSHINSHISTGIIVKGKLTVIDSTAKDARPVIGSGNTVEQYQFGSINTGNDGTKRNAIQVKDGGSFVLESGTVSATNIAVYADGSINGAGQASSIEIRGGYVEAQEAAVLVRGQGARAEITDGVLLCKDNAVVSGNGLPQYAGTEIEISGGTLIGKITTPGYIACGIYHPQRGTLKITGGDIRASGGVGILMRGGSLLLDKDPARELKITADGNGTGKVGDAALGVDAGNAVVLDQKSGYYDGGSVVVEAKKQSSDTTDLSQYKVKEYTSDGFELKKEVTADGIRYSIEQEPTASAKRTVTFDLNYTDAPAAGTVQVDDGGKVTKPADPTRGGYTFGGWYREAACTTLWDFDNDTVTADTTLYAKWEKDEKPPVDPDDEDEYRIYAPGSVSGGRVYVSHSTAAPGTRITIELRPWSDYELDWISVVNLDTDRELRLTERYSDEYTFIMPSSDVEVDVSYTDRYYYGSSWTYYVREETPADPRPVKWYYSNGSIYHVTDGLVPYGGQLTRDMLLSVLYNMDPASTGDPTIWAANHGIIPDIYISELWGVDKPINREQTAMILYCYSQHMGYSTAQSTSLTGYADYRQISDAARPAVSWARGAGLIAGTSANTLSPRAVLTCGQAGAILSRFAANVARTW